MTLLLVSDRKTADGGAKWIGFAPDITKQLKECSTGVPRREQRFKSLWLCRLDWYWGAYLKFQIHAYFLKHVPVPPVRPYFALRYRALGD
jgi:hypothetical protein